MQRTECCCMLCAFVLDCRGWEGRRFPWCFSTPYPLRRSNLRSSRWATRSSFALVCMPAPPCPSLPLHCTRFLSLVHAHELTTPLPRALQVGIWALSTPTKTPEYPLAQNSTLFLVVPVAFSESWVVKIVGDRSVSGTRCGRAQGGSLRGLFWDYMLCCCIVIIVWCGVFVTMWYEAVVITIWAHLVASGLYYI